MGDLPTPVVLHVTDVDSARRAVREAVRVLKHDGQGMSGRLIETEVGDQSDLLLPILEKHVRAMGGRLRLAAVFPQVATVKLTMKGRIVSVEPSEGSV